MKRIRDGQRILESANTALLAIIKRHQPYYDTHKDPGLQRQYVETVANVIALQVNDNGWNLVDGQNILAVVLGVTAIVLVNKLSPGFEGFIVLMVSVTVALLWFTFSRMRRPSQEAEINLARLRHVLSTDQPLITVAEMLKAPIWKG